MVDIARVVFIAVGLTRTKVAAAGGAGLVFRVVEFRVPVVGAPVVGVPVVGVPVVSVDTWLVLEAVYTV